MVELLELAREIPSFEKYRPATRRGGELFRPSLDLSQYTAARKVHDFHMVDLSSNDKDEAIRKASLIYAGN